MLNEQGGALAPWLELAAGRGCPFCTPRPDASDYLYFICKLSVSSLYLARKQAYRGTCAIIYDPSHATRPSELAPDQWQHFCADAWTAESAVSRAFGPDHVNLACLGNTVPHLHMGIIPRYRSDPRWGRPIWTSEDEISISASDAECEDLARQLRACVPGEETAHIPPGWHTVTPRIVVTDPPALVTFVQAVFHATGEFDPQKPTVLSIGDSKLMVSGTVGRASREAFLYVYVPEIEPVYRRALQHGAKSIEAPLTTPYGDRRCMVEDPWGNWWQIATYGASVAGPRMHAQGGDKHE